MLIRIISESYSKHNCQLNLTIVLSSKDHKRNWDRFTVGEQSNSKFLTMNDNAISILANRNFNISRIRREVR